MRRIDTIVLHWTGGEGDAGQVQRTLRQRGCSVHYFIDRAGVRWQFAPDDRVIYSRYQELGALAGVLFDLDPQELLFFRVDTDGRPSRQGTPAVLVVKDTDGKPVDTRYGFDGAWAGAPDLGLYYPMQVRYTAVLVPPGGTFTGFPP